MYVCIIYTHTYCNSLSKDEQKGLFLCMYIYTYIYVYVCIGYTQTLQLTVKGRVCRLLYIHICMYIHTQIYTYAHTLQLAVEKRAKSAVWREYKAVLRGSFECI